MFVIYRNVTSVSWFEIEILFLRNQRSSWWSIRTGRVPHRLQWRHEARTATTERLSRRKHHQQQRLAILETSNTHLRKCRRFLLITIPTYLLYLHSNYYCHISWSFGAVFLTNYICLFDEELMIRRYYNSMLLINIVFIVLLLF
jgi:hypothetical protein